MESPAATAPAGRPSRLDRAVRRLVEALSILLLVALTGVCALEVISRNFAGASLGWADELAGYLLVWLTFLGAALAQLDSGHIGVDVVSRYFSRDGARGVEMGAQILLLVLQLFLLVFGVEVALGSLRDRATSLPIPMGILYAVIPLSALLLGIVHAVTLRKLASGERGGH